MVLSRVISCVVCFVGLMLLSMTADAYITQQCVNANYLKFQGMTSWGEQIWKILQNPRGIVNNWEISPSTQNAKPLHTTDTIEVYPELVSFYNYRKLNPTHYISETFSCLYQYHDKTTDAWGLLNIAPKSMPSYAIEVGPEWVISPNLGGPFLQCGDMVSGADKCPWNWY